MAAGALVENKENRKAQGNQCRKQPSQAHIDQGMSGVLEQYDTFMAKVKNMEE